VKRDNSLVCSSGFFFLLFASSQLLDLLQTPIRLLQAYWLGRIGPCSVTILCNWAYICQCIAVYGSSHAEDTSDRHYICVSWRINFQ
jgi:hypothetical protein